MKPTAEEILQEHVTNAAFLLDLDEVAVIVKAMEEYASQHPSDSARKEVSDEEIKILLRQSIRELRRFTKGQKSSPSTEVLIDKLWRYYESKLTRPTVSEEEIDGNALVEKYRKSIKTNRQVHIHPEHGVIFYYNEVAQMFKAAISELLKDRL